MLDELETHRDAIASLCRRFDVASLSVFGSATTDEFDATRSDLDLLVSFHPRSGMSRFDAYFGLKESLEALFGRGVDLVSADAVDNPYFARAVEGSRRELYAA